MKLHACLHACAILFIAALCTLPVRAADVVRLTDPEMAGISGFREYWNRPVPIAPDGALRLSDHGRFGKGEVADWSTDAPGAPVFDAVHRSLLIRFPDAATRIAAELRAGKSIAKVELLLPFRDTEYFPMHYDMPAGLSFLGDTWVKEPPRWHAVAWALRKPWSADAEIGPTYNAAIHGAVYWDQYGATGDAGDRLPVRFGPAELSHATPHARLDVTASLTDDAFGATIGERLRTFADCGVMLRKWELYDARYWRGGYEWGVATGQRGILIGQPALEVTFGPAAGPAPGELPPAADFTALATAPRQGEPTATIPSETDFTQLASEFAFTRPAWAADWQWQRLQQLHQLGGGHGFPATYADYLRWIDGMLSLHPRAWKGFSASEMAAEFSMYHQAMPEPVKDHLRLYWSAWLMPDRPYAELVHGYIGGKEAREYYERTGDWRGNFSVYRTYLHSMGTTNFNSWASTGAMFGGYIIGDPGIMDEAREGYDHWMTRTWTWADGTSQESIDHYYFAHTMGPLKTIKDFAPGPEERLAGQLNVDKHMDELIATWHPNLRRFVSSSGRSGIAYLLYLQEGLNYIMHTLSPAGALTDVGNEQVADRRGGAFAREFPPGQVALQTQHSPWAEAAAGELVDHKPLPYEATRAYIQWGGFAQTPLWKKSYLSEHFGLASIDVSRSEIIPVMAQWRRQAAPVTSWTQLGTMLARYGVNDTEFLDSIFHGTDRRNPNGIVGAQGGSTVTVQGRHQAIILGSPFSDPEKARGRAMPDSIHSLQMSMALFNFEAEPTWRLHIDGQPVGALPVSIPFGSRITLHDGVTYVGIMPIPATDLGRDTEVLISARPQTTEMQGGGKVAVTLSIDAYNYRSDTPLDFQNPSRERIDRAINGFVVELGDTTRFADFAAFQAHVQSATLDVRQNAEEPLTQITYTSGDDTLEVGFDPTAPMAQPTTAIFPWRRFNGEWPYLPEGIFRDTTTAIQGRAGTLEKNGARLLTKPGTMAYLQAFAERDVYVGYNPFRERVPFRLELPGGVIAQTDGTIGQARVEIRPRAGQIHLQAAATEASDDLRQARALVITGLQAMPTATLEGQPVPVTETADGYVVPLVTNWQPAMATEAGERLRIQRELEAIPPHAGTILEWQIIGPFPAPGGRLDTPAYPPEVNVDLNADITIGDQTLAWKQVTLPAPGPVDLLQHVARANEVVAYAYAVIDSAEAQQAQLLLGSDDGIVAWVNGREVLRREVFRAARPDQERVMVDLQRGANTILLKISQDGGGWAFYARLVDLHGRPTGL